MRLAIDGSYGEGGGEILRSSLALSIALGRPVEIHSIRKGRKVPGLQPQHLTAVKAAAAISAAEVEGAALGSERLRFAPGPVRPGSYRFDVAEERGSAGAATLVLQTVLLPLVLANAPSTVTVRGGTHVPWSPPAHYLRDLFLPIFAELGGKAYLEIHRWGWYPKGGGELKLSVEPAAALTPLALTERGRLLSLRGISATSNLPRHVAERQRSRARQLLASRGLDAEIELIDAPASGKGSFLFLLAEFERARAAFSALGALGKPAEKIAEEACRDLFAYLDSEGAADPHLADQIIRYLALAAGPSRLTTTCITSHLLTNIWVVRQFLPIRIVVTGELGQPGSVTIDPTSAIRPTI